MSKDILIVTGPGRSGTSLCMAILKECGARVSENLLRGSDYPSGLLEDRYVVETDKRLMAKLFYEGLVPRPPIRNQPVDIRVEVGDLSRVIRKNTRLRPIWAVKDPRISLLREPWNRAIRNTKVNPIYIFCYRDPRQVSASMVSHFKWDAVQGEYMWLVRTAYFFAGITEPVAVVPFEKWFKRPDKTLLDLLKHTPLKPKREAKLSALALVNEKLPHALEVQGVKYSQTRELYKALSASDAVVSPSSDVVTMSKSIVADIQKWTPIATELYRLADAVK